MLSLSWFITSQRSLKWPIHWLPLHKKLKSLHSRHQRTLHLCTTLSGLKLNTCTLSQVSYCFSVLVPQGYIKRPSTGSKDNTLTFSPFAYAQLTFCIIHWLKPLKSLWLLLMQFFFIFFYFDSSCTHINWLLSLVTFFLISALYHHLWTKLNKSVVISLYITSLDADIVEWSVYTQWESFLFSCTLYDWIQTTWESLKNEPQPRVWVI